MMRRRALTLVETLAGCFCFSILAAIALPAVNAVRMDAKAVDCANRIRQIGLASHNYHDAYKRLPPGTLGVTGAVAFDDWNQGDGQSAWRNQQNTSALGCIGHFIELNTLMDKCDPFLFDLHRDLTQYIDAKGKPVYKQLIEIVGVQKVAATDVEIYLCPSDDLGQAKPAQFVIATQPVIREADPSDDMGLKYCSNDEAWAKGLTNYIGNGGVCGGEGSRNNTDQLKKGFAGPLLSRTRVSLETIHDGTSNTILFGENIGEIKNGNRTAANCWLLGGRSRGRGNVPWQMDAVEDVPAQRILGDSKWASVVGFGSKHEAGVNFARCDGSVMMLTRDIDFETLYAVMGARDGQVADVEPFDVSRKLRRKAELEASKEARELLKGNPVVQAMENDPVLDREMKSEGILGYAELLMQRKPLLDKTKKAAKGIPVLEAIVDDPYLSIDEKSDFVRQYLRLMNDEDSPDAIERRPEPPQAAKDEGKEIE